MVATGTGFRGDRKYTGGPQEQVAAHEEQQQRVSTQLPVFRRAIVVDVFYDPIIQLTDDVKEKLFDEVTNPSLINRIKRNCIIARIITGEADRQNDRPSIFFPLLDPYISMPIKPGEQVYVIFEDPATGNDVGSWLCRIPEPIDVDDVNYTHGDRRYADNDFNRDTIDELTPSIPEPPGFPNGDSDEDSLTIGQPDEYEHIVSTASATKQFQPETVPRWTKRPGDTVIQGSNNTLITLMSERTGPATNSEEVAEGEGAIYIVAGRGQDENTAPNIVKNSRENFEVDKTPGLRNLKDVSTEGDPNFDSDSSLIYMSMKADIDDEQHFDINISNGGEATESELPSLVLKTDQLRLIGRSDVKIQAGTNETGAAIILKANGDIILIPGPAGIIKLGGEDADHAALGHVGVNSGGTVVGTPILSTMGGVTGTPAQDPHGSFSTKILFKS